MREEEKEEHKGIQKRSPLEGMGFDNTRRCLFSNYRNLQNQTPWRKLKSNEGPHIAPLWCSTFKHLIISLQRSQNKSHTLTSYKKWSFSSAWKGDGGGTPRSYHKYPCVELVRSHTFERSNSTQILQTHISKECDPSLPLPSEFQQRMQQS